MPAFTGTVSCLQISEVAGLTTLEDATGDQETFILYWLPGIPPVLNSFTRILHSMWIALLRDAITNNRTVKIGHEGAVVDLVQLR